MLRTSSMQIQNEPGEGATGKAKLRWRIESLVEDRPYLLFPLSIILGLMVWEVAGWSLSAALLAPASAVLVRFVEMLADGTLPLAFASSIQHMALGYGLAVAAAVPLGVALGRSPSVATACEPVINAIYAIPPVAFVPFLIVWFGFYFEGRVALVFLMCFFEILINVQQGVRNVDHGLLEAAESLGVRGMRLYRKVVIPAALPFIFTGLRVGIGRAVNAMITAELFFAAVNIGKLLKSSGNAFDTASMFGIILSVSIFGLICQELTRFAERRLLPWHHQGCA